ncbi:G8 domain-containing protein [Aquimarina brevivitae]|uniref:G8 domain-containing protein n=1 Tax=Aquimarina brevivitae TaxID=323412 RepID=A0A4Q7NYA9_9FLAO|nr:G8 domain-containing protein [Aquimarina brevivitae]RZS92227.1 G8 domain-containing protein [Aquimarina brevivitae]
MKPLQSCLYMGLILFSTYITAQQNITAGTNETIELRASQLESNQDIQWQTSTNNQEWSDLAQGDAMNITVTLNNLPVYFRAKITDTECSEAIFSELITVESPSSDKLYWSDPNTWGTDGKPQAGDVVVIPEDKFIYLDEDTPDLASLTIRGGLKFEDQDVTLTSGYVFINGGSLIVGTESEPFANKAIITLNDTNTDTNIMQHMGTRGIIVANGGVLNLHGQSPTVTWTKLNAHATDGATQLTLAENVDWSVGDEIVIGPTDYYEADDGNSITQRFSIAAVNGNQISLNSPLQSFHWGMLQYATADGISLSPGHSMPAQTGDFLYGLQPTNPTVLDERAPIGNLTRNIVIQSPDDALWQNERFGAHIMVGHDASAYIEGIEIKRAGQRGRLRRYPVHWHMLSYSGSQTLEDATGQYLKNSTINTSANRGVVVHGTNGLLIKNNIVFDVKGHAIFTEDAAERRTVFDGNLVLKVRNPLPEFALKNHELRGHARGSSGFWISNPDNTTINNHIADIEGAGYWLAFPAHPFGSSSQAQYEDGLIMNPRRMPFGVFENNTVHTVNGHGFHNDNPEIDEDGNTGDSGFKDYISDATGRNNVWPRTTWQRFDIKGLKIWKTRGIWERASYLNAIEITAADNYNKFFSGSGENGLIIGGLIIGRSENHGMNASNHNNKPTPAAFASYHHTFSLQGNQIINFPATLGEESGSFSTFDYYLRPVEKGHWLTNGNRLINSHPGLKLSAAEGWGLNRVDPDQPHFNLAGALWDPKGFWGPENNYLVFDRPFYTYGHQTYTQNNNPEGYQGVSVAGPFYGFDDTIINAINGTTDNRTTMVFTRYDDNLNQIDQFTLYQNQSDLLQHMKDFAAQKGGIYEVNYPDLDEPFYIKIGSVTNFLSEEDEVVIAVEYTGDKDAEVVASRQHVDNDIIHEYQQVSSFSEVVNSNTEAFWQDKPNDKVWLKVKGGRVNAVLTDMDFWEDSVYQQFSIQIRENTN